VLEVGSSILDFEIRPPPQLLRLRKHLRTGWEHYVGARGRPRPINILIRQSVGAHPQHVACGKRYNRVRSHRVNRVGAHGLNRSKIRERRRRKQYPRRVVDRTSGKHIIGLMVVDFIRVYQKPRVVDPAWRPTDNGSDKAAVLVNIGCAGRGEAEFIWIAIVPLAASRTSRPFDVSIIKVCPARSTCAVPYCPQLGVRQEPSPVARSEPVT
jgi:hypothetical protein